MSTVELNIAWFSQPAFGLSVKRESHSQLNENVFDSSEMFIDATSISEMSSKRFESLRAITVNGLDLFPANHFDSADYFGEQFLSHAVFSSLFDQHIRKFRRADRKLLHNSVLGEVQTQFYLSSSPEYFFYDRAEWNSQLIEKNKQDFQIGRPSERVRDYVHLRRIEVRREIETGGLKSREYGIYEQFLEAERRHAGNARSEESPTGAPRIDSTSASVLIEKFSGSESQISDKNLLKDFLDLMRALNLVKHCRNEAVTPSDYQQFMNDWENTPKAIRGATEIQQILWRWLYVSFPDDRHRYFHTEGDSESEVNKKTKARSRRLKKLNELLKNAAMRASL